jgi:hypothetical protein
LVHLLGKVEWMASHCLYQQNNAACQFQALPIGGSLACQYGQSASAHQSLPLGLPLNSLVFCLSKCRHMPLWWDVHYSIDKGYEMVLA